MSHSRTTLLLLWAFAFALAAISLALDGWRGFNPSDEGFVWHAAWRARHGDVPVRDYLSYDAGRHYWEAAWMWLLDADGLFTLRLADTVFQALGLAAGLFALTRFTQDWRVLSLVGVLLMLGMTPSYKLFEPALAMMMVLVAVRLIESSSTNRYIQAGVLAGLAGFIGRNLGAYAVLAIGLVMVLLAVRNRRIELLNYGAFIGGVFAGYLPAMGLMLASPGFAAAMWDSIVRLFEVGAANNLTLPVPWPWTLEFGKLDNVRALAEWCRGFTYLSMALFLVFAPLLLWLGRHGALANNALLASSWAVALVFSHHAFGRAGASHLAQSFHPFLIGLLAVAQTIDNPRMRRVYRTIATTAVGIAVAGVLVIRPFVRQALNTGGAWTSVSIAGSMITMPAPLAKDIAAFREIHERCIGKSNAFFVAPYWPAAYPLLETKSATWDTYFLFRETDRRQLKLIDQLKQADVRWSILDESGMDGMEERRFRNTYPLVHQWIERNFVEVHVPQLPRGHRLLVRSDLHAGGSRSLCSGWGTE